jgi:ATP-dependent DNA ligase
MGAVVPQVRCSYRNQVNSMLETAMQKGGEGLMLRHPTAEYKGGRSTDLLKVKRLFDKERRGGHRVHCRHGFKSWARRRTRLYRRREKAL